MPRKPTRRMTPAERIEAQLLAEEMLCRRTQQPVIVAALVAEFAGISEAVAKRIAVQALKDMVANVKANAPHRREQQLASLDRLYERALEAGKYGAAVSAQRLIATLEGNAKPKPKPWDRKPEAAAAPEADEFEGRSEDECDYYAEHGYFPDEAPGAAGSDDDDDGAPDSAFPLN